MSTFATGFPKGWWVQALAIDVHGNVFVATGQPYDPCDPNIGQELPGAIYTVAANGGTVSPFASTPAFGFGAAVDIDGNVYVSTGGRYLRRQQPGRRDS